MIGLQLTSTYICFKDQTSEYFNTCKLILKKYIKQGNYMLNRVVITGIGIISSIGEGEEQFWDSVINGKSGISEVEYFNTSEYKIHKAGEVKNFKFQKYFSDETLSHLGRTSQLAVSAVQMAIKKSGLNFITFNKDRIGISIGSAIGEVQIEEKISKIWVDSGIEKIPADYYLNYPMNNIPVNIARIFDFRGPNFIFSTACSAGNYAIGYGYSLIRQGLADIMITGGVDSFSRVAFTGFHRLFSIAPDMCQPFDKNRSGIIIGEGAGILILESLENALKRNAYIYAEIIGYGLSCDGYHVISPHPDGRGGIKCIQKALENANIYPEEIQYISAHGTGTKENDRIETKIIKFIFQSYAYKIPISSIKSMIGHTMGAASAIEAILCALVIKNNIIPPTINYFEPDPECDLDYVPNKARESKVDIAISNSFAFGGNNAALIIKKF